MDCIEYHISFDMPQRVYSRDKIEIPVNPSSGSALTTLTTEAEKIKLTKWRTGPFFVVRTQYISKNRIPIIREIHGVALCLSFIHQGTLLYQHGPFFSGEMIQHTNNLFLLRNEKVICRAEDEHTECFDIHISPGYIESLSKRHPCLFEKLYEKITNKEPFELCQSHLLTTPEMSQIIEQIKKLPLTDKTASLSFEAKVLELMALQLEQAEKQTCRYCDHCFIRYRDQLNKAKKIIEQQYKNPPGIHELALMVGMCDTQLKAGFKFLFNHTIYGHLFDYRMNMARRVLKETSKSIAAVAEHAGYEHQSHFTTAFKRKFGITPMTYRKTI